MSSSLFKAVVLAIASAGATLLAPLTARGYPLTTRNHAKETFCAPAEKINAVAAIQAILLT